MFPSVYFYRLISYIKDVTTGDNGFRRMKYKQHQHTNTHLFFSSFTEVSVVDRSCSCHFTRVNWTRYTFAHVAAKIRPNSVSSPAQISSAQTQSVGAEGKVLSDFTTDSRSERAWRGRQSVACSLVRRGCDTNTQHSHDTEAASRKLRIGRSASIAPSSLNLYET